jgi:hypothetical protein
MMESGVYHAAKTASSGPLTAGVHDLAGKEQQKGGLNRPTLSPAAIRPAVRQASS